MKRIGKKTRIDRRNLDRVDQKKCFYSLYFPDGNIYDRKKTMHLQIIINCDVIKNFIFQLKMRKLNINEVYVSTSKFKIFDDTTLRTYSNHILRIKIVYQTNYVNFDCHDFIATNMMSI